jgi:hypothetical protein
LRLSADLVNEISLDHVFAYQDYDRGPLPDHDRIRPGSIWEFIKNVDGIEVYIKLKLDPNRGCMSLLP